LHFRLLYIVDAYTTIAGAIERARRREKRSLLKNTLSPVKSSASLRLKKKSNSQSNSSSRRDIAPIKVVSGSIKSTKPIA
jgi:hypothetical protein